MSRQNRRQQMDRRRSEFLQAFKEDADKCVESLNVTQSMSDQDQRLTNKHIKTLTFLQDIVNENKSVKARNDELEAQLSECSEIHELAREGQEKLKEMQSQYLEKIDEISEALLEKHQSELMRIVNEKVDLEKVWQAEKISLQNENQRLRASLSELSGSLSQARETSDRAQMIQLKLDALAEENALLKEEQHRYVAENENLRSEVQSLHRAKQQNESLKNDLKSANQSQKELQLRYDRLSKDSEESGDGSGKPFLMDQVKNKLSKLTQERRMLTERCQQLETENEKLCHVLNEYSQQMDNSELVKERLLVEINMLREELQKKQRARPSGEKDFREFVSIKRELVALKEENEELSTKVRHRRARTQSLLPALKGPEPRPADRRLSASSVLSRKP